MADLQQQFEEALAWIKTSEGGDFKPSNDQKLEMYALYKQATEGDVSGKKPGITDMVGRAKYNAWAGLKGTSQDDAKQTYVDKVNSFK